MVIAFFLGFSIDSFWHQPGFHAAACVLIAYVRPFLVNMLVPQDGYETNYEEPSVKSLGGLLPYFIYIGFFTFLHNAWLFLLEAWQFNNLWYFLVKTVFSTAICLLLIIITELVIVRKQKFRTNTI
jgi:pilus assembly protein TadC